MWSSLHLMMRLRARSFQVCLGVCAAGPQALTLTSLSCCPRVPCCRSQLEAVLRGIQPSSLFGQVDAMLMDLGVSSMQVGGSASISVSVMRTCVAIFFSRRSIALNKHLTDWVSYLLSDAAPSLSSVAKQLCILGETNLPLLLPLHLAPALGHNIPSVLAHGCLAHP